MSMWLKQFCKYLATEQTEQMGECVDSVGSLGSYYGESKKYIGNRQKQEGSSFKVCVCANKCVYVCVCVCNLFISLFPASDC